MWQVKSSKELNIQNLHNIRVIRVSRRIMPIAGGQEQHVTEVSDYQSRHGLLNLVLHHEGGEGGKRFFESRKIPYVREFKKDLFSGFQFGYLSARYISSVFKNGIVLHSHGTYADLMGLATLSNSNIEARLHTFHGMLGLKCHEVKILRSLIKKLDGIFVVNELIKKQLEMHIEKLPPVFVLTSGVSDCFYDVKPEVSNCRMLMVGRLVYVKGFDTGLRVAKLLQSQGVISGVDVIGDGPELNNLQKLSGSLNLSVDFHGRLTKQEIAVVMSKAKVLLVPSRTLVSQAEGSPTVILEAWAAGVPVVATRSGGIPSLVREGVDGMLANEDEVEDIACAVLRALSNQRLVSAGKQRVIGYTWGKVSLLIRDVYQQLSSI